MKKLTYWLFLLLIVCTAPLYAQELTVWCSGGLMPVIQQVATRWEERSGIGLHIEAAPSMGDTPQSIPQRLAHRQHADVLVMVDAGIRPLAIRGWVDEHDKVALANSRIAVAVPAGDPVPDISSTDRLRSVLLRAGSVAYSDSASGLYVSQQLFQRLGIAPQMVAKSRMIQATPVGKIVAAHQVDIGFQQLSELQAVPGLTIVGLLPQEVQQITLYSAIPLKHSQSQSRSFIRYLTSGEVADVIREEGMEPLNIKH